MKKFAALLVVLSMGLFVFSGCGDSTKTDTTTKTEKTDKT